ncbi:MAG: hypothetical protein ABSE96_20400 [Terracidiphilus sp.]
MTPVTCYSAALGAGLPAAAVCRQGERVAFPFGSNGLAIGGELAANAIWVGDQEGPANPEAHETVRVIVQLHHLGRGGRIGRGQYIHVPFPWEICGNLKDFHASAGSDHDACEFRH